jgi:tetratricopeptide (TPR) repeat protein
MELIKSNKTNGQALYELGKIHLILNNFEKAVDFFDRAISISPMNSKMILKKSMAYFAQQKYEDAILCLEQIPEVDDLYNNAQFEKSKIQMLQGNTKQAIEILSKVIKTNDVFKLVASNEVIFESISNMFEFKELIK